jgi:hypothetical protein
MQDKNRTQKHALKKGDGTVHEREKSNDANWFGASREPQEEFMEQDNQEPNEKEPLQRDEKNPHTGQMSEGKPSI